VRFPILVQPVFVEAAACVNNRGKDSHRPTGARCRRGALPCLLLRYRYAVAQKSRAFVTRNDDARLCKRCKRLILLMSERGIEPATFAVRMLKSYDLSSLIEIPKIRWNDRSDERLSRLSYFLC
jgi:hypothetical protein